MDNNMKPIRCIVVGAGATGSMVSCFLKRLYGERLSLQVWDKGRGAGGRMSTTRYGKNSALSLDLGAQYISATKEYQIKHQSVYDELLRNGILTPLTATIDGMKTDDETNHFVTPSGINTIPKYFLDKSECSSRFLVNLKEVNINASIVACAQDNNPERKNERIEEEADVIIITMPIPQLLDLNGDIRTYVEPWREQLSAVSYSSRFALGLFYEHLKEISNVEWASKYIRNNPCLCFISVDSKKRQKDSSGGLSIVAHASVPFSINHLEKSFEEIEPIMMEYVQKEMPGLPKPDKSRVIRWRYSQVTKAFAGTPGHIVLNESPLVLCAGDAFSHSNFDGCINSANSVVERIKTHFPLFT